MGFLVRFATVQLLRTRGVRARRQCGSQLRQRSATNNHAATLLAFRKYLSAPCGP